MTETVSNTDDLLEQARARLRELEEQADTGDELGERITLEPGQHFLGRYRGEVEMRTRDGETIAVLGFWDQEGRKRFHYKTAGLVMEFDADPVAIGDDVVLVRGEDREFEAQGELRTMHRFAVRSKSSPDPLPGDAAESPSSGQLADDEEFPF
jgi:hypothetical protein